MLFLLHPLDDDDIEAADSDSDSDHDDEEIPLPNNAFDLALIAGLIVLYRSMEANGNGNGCHTSRHMASACACMQPPGVPPHWRRAVEAIHL